MRRVLCLLLIPCLFTAPLRANMGETIEQCVARYGKPNGYTEAGPHSPFGTLVFVAGKFVLTIFVYDNKEVGARVAKSDKTPFSDGDLQAIMSADSGGSAWVAGKSDDTNSLAWNRSDGATVFYDGARHLVVFTSPAMATALKENAAKQAQATASTSNAAPISEPTNVVKATFPGQVFSTPNTATTNATTTNTP